MSAFKDGEELLTTWAASVRGDNPKTATGPTPGPVVTETVKRIKPGTYGAVHIPTVYPDGVNVYANSGKWSAADLRAAAAVLTEIADALDEAR